MDQITDEINKELTFELYELKKQLKKSMMENYEKDKTITELQQQLQKIDIEGFEAVKYQLEAAEKHIQALEEICRNLCYEKNCLTQNVLDLQNRFIQSSMVKSAEHYVQNQPDFQTVQEVESQLKPKSEEEEEHGSTSGSTNDNDYSNEKYSTEESEKEVKYAKSPAKNNRKVMTIAMKLKLSRDDLSATPQSPQQSPKFYANNKKASKVKVRSIMIGGLFRKLTRDDLIEYFGRFGQVVECVEPQKSFSQNDGKKFAFLKFIDCDSVEKAVATSQHSIKNVNVIAKKSYMDK